MNAQPRLIISTADAMRLEALIAGRPEESLETAALLEQEIARADIRDSSDMPGQVVRMNSDVVMLDEATGVERRVRVVYPPDAGSSPHAVSVLAPVGAALIGVSAGDTIHWPMPGGRATRLRVLRVVDGGSH
jgi:regulator of nucleoside diphosphate kinase